MNPLKVMWFHMRARVRLFHIWLVVQLGLHRKAPSRIRSKLVKAAGWLEATVLNANSNASIEGKTRDAITETYDKLQADMAKIQQGEHGGRRPSREDIDSIKEGFLHLLDLCGIKDADIPPLNEPVPLRQTHQTLITSFGMMSKSLNGISGMTTPPQRRRRTVRRDPASYADRLIEQLMAEASPDSSDTSPPSNNGGESSNHPPRVTGGDATPISSNSLSDPQQEAASVVSSRVQSLVHRFETANSSSSPSSPARLHKPSSPASDARCEWVEEDHLALPSHHHQHLLQVLPTSDSGITASGSSHTIGSSATMSPPIQEQTHVASKCNINTTTGSTPELPAVGAASSESLDIPNASFFGKLDTLNSSSAYSKPLSAKSDIPTEESEVSSDQKVCYNFPLKYSHSYARELRRLETEMFSDIQLDTEPDYVPSPKAIPRASTDNSSKDVDKRYIFHEPLVVILPKEKEAGNHHYNLNNNYKPSLEDKSAVEAEENSPKPPIPPRVPLTSSKPTNTSSKEKQNRVCQFVLAAEPDQDIGSVWCGRKSTEPSSEESPCNMSWQCVESPPQQVPANSIVSSSMSTGKAHLREKKKGQAVAAATSTHHHRQPASPLRAGSHLTPTSASKRRKANDRSPMPIEHNTTASPPSGSGQATKSARRLFLSPSRTNSPLRPSIGMTSLIGSSDHSAPSSPLSPRMERMRRSKRHSPAMRRLMQEKENNLLSPSKSQTSPRKPFGDVYNIQLNGSDPLTTSSNSLSPSSGNYAKSSDTSPDMPLVSREEDLLDRNAYYEDFTVDRDHKLDNLTPQQKRGLLNKGSQNNFYTLKDPSSDEILVRQVEGAESSPTIKPVFQAPLPNTRAPRSVRVKSQSSHQQTRPHSTSSSGSRSSSPTSAGVNNKYHPRKSNKSRRRSSSSSRRSSSSGPCSSHPMASSTLIMEPPELPEKDEETGSVYTWSIEEGSETCNLERSFLRSQSERKNRKKNKKNPLTSRPPTNIGRDSSDISDFEEMKDEKSSFEITAMVSAIGKSLNCSSGQQVDDSFCDMTTIPGTPKQQTGKPRFVFNSLPRTSTRSTISSKGIVSAAPNLRNRISKTPSSTGSSSNSIPSSGNQPSTPSAAFNRAKGSISSVPTSSSSDEQQNEAAPPLKAVPQTNLVKAISASAPDLVGLLHHEDLDASHSIEPSDTDSTPEIASSVLDERSDIPGKSNSSGSSTSCTAARCRPRDLSQGSQGSHVLNSKDSNSRTDNEANQQQQPSTSALAAAATAQDLMDSILTDSPKSVDSSGIFAPYNSYNSPAESVGSHNGYSSTVSSSVASSDSYFPITVRLVQNDQYIPSDVILGAVRTPQAIPQTPPPLAAAAATASDDSVFKKPFSPAPHIDRTAKTPVTRSQGVNVTASTSSTPTRPMSVRSDPLANQSIFAVPPGVVTGPPKISNKKSLVKKLKRFSTNFYKKGEKIETLTYL